MITLMEFIFFGFGFVIGMLIAYMIFAGLVAREYTKEKERKVE